MSRYTLLDAKNSRIPAVLNTPPTDARFTQYVNQSQQMLLRRGNWWGTYASYLVCTHDSCLVWPRQVAAVISLAVCGAPVTIRNQFYEYLQAGPGIQTNSRCGDTDSDSECNQPNWCHCQCPAGMQLIDRGTTCTYRDIRGDNKKIRVYADVNEAAGAKILLLGYDENQNWIRTQVDGNWVDGEYVTISTTPTTSVNIFTSLTGVQKPLTNGNVRLYEFNVDDSTQVDIAIYEPTEYNPSYRKSLIANMQGQGCCGNLDEDGNRRGQVNIMAKLEFIPARVDTDWLIIGNLEAIEYQCQAVRKLENNLFQEAIAWEARAIAELDAELKHYIPISTVRPMRFQGRRFAGGGVLNLIG